MVTRILPCVVTGQDEHAAPALVNLVSDVLPQLQGCRGEREERMISVLPCRSLFHVTCDIDREKLPLAFFLVWFLI
jgi:hypothetical protein